MAHSSKDATVGRSRGQIIPRGDKKWLIRVFQGRHPATGKRQYENLTVTGTKLDAQKALTAHLQALDGHRLPVTNKVTVREYLPTWLQSILDIAPATRVNYLGQITRNIIPGLGHARVDSLTWRTIQDHFSSLLSSKGLSHRTVSLSLGVLSQALDSAVRDGLLPSNPCEHVRLPQKLHREKIHWTPEQGKRFLELSAAHEWNPLFTVMFYTGMRPQELAALKWDDVRGAEITVQRAAVKDTSGAYVLSFTKTAGSVRRLPLPALARAALDLQQQHLHGMPNPLNLCFPNSAGNVMDLSKLSKQFAGALHAVNVRILEKSSGVLQASDLLPKTTLYGLRHGHASLLSSLGVNPKVVSERLGHSTIKLTMDTYTHVSPTMQDEVVTKINAAS